MESSDIERIGDELGLLEVRDVDEGVVHEVEGEAVIVELPGEPVVAVEVELESEGRPGGHPQVAEAQLFVDEIKVIVKALAIGDPQRGPAGAFVVPGLEGRATLHGREDMHQPRMIAALLDDLLDASLLAKVVELADELDLETSLLGDFLGVVPQLVSELVDEGGVLEELDA
jgi:hypothetical protein